MEEKGDSFDFCDIPTEFNKEDIKELKDELKNSALRFVSKQISNNSK